MTTLTLRYVSSNKKENKLVEGGGISSPTYAVGSYNVH